MQWKESQLILQKRVLHGINLVSVLEQKLYANLIPFFLSSC